jgi:hypothetical protein
MADWIVARRDNGKAPFFIIDKRDARLYVFRPSGELSGARPCSSEARRATTRSRHRQRAGAAGQAFQRTTPAGRFITQPGLDLERSDVVGSTTTRPSRCTASSTR